MLIVVHSDKPVAEIARNFPQVCATHGFGLLGSYDFRQKMQEKGVTFDHDCQVFEVCNPKAAKQVLEKNLAIATAMPCRIAIYEEGGRTTLATLKPTAMLQMFGVAGLATVAQEVERTMTAIMDDLK